MASTTITAVTPAARPVDDIVARTEGGADAALAAARTLLPGRDVRYAQESSWIAGGDGLLVATYGWTAVFFGTDPDDLVVPVGQGVFSLTYESVSGSFGVTVAAGEQQRFAVLSPGSLDVDEGEPLPFELPFWSGEHDEFPDETPAFDVAEWGTAAALWMFGYDPMLRRTDTPVDARTQPLHVLLED